MEPKPNQVTRHHLTNKKKGGNGLPNNILKIKWSRHKAFHKLYRNMEWEDVARLLCMEDHGHRTKLRKWHHPHFWKECWGNKSIYDVVQLMQRISKLKKRTLC